MPDFLFLGSKITEDGDCSHEIRRRLLLGRKAMTNRRVKSGSSTDFIFLGSKITADHDYCHEIKRHLFLGRKDITTLDSVLKKKPRHHFC